MPVLIKYMGAMGKDAYGIEPRLEKSQWSTIKILAAWNINTKSHAMANLDQLTQLAKDGKLEQVK